MLSPVFLRFSPHSLRRLFDLLVQRTGKITTALRSKYERPIYLLSSNRVETHPRVVNRPLSSLDRPPSISHRNFYQRFASTFSRNQIEIQIVRYIGREGEKSLSPKKFNETRSRSRERSDCIIGPRFISLLPEEGENVRKSDEGTIMRLETNFGRIL